jgi:hypothetical protein
MSKKDQSGNSRDLIEITSLFMVPDRCIIGLVEANSRQALRASVFGLIELQYDADGMDQFLDIVRKLRQSSAIRLTHMPNIMEENESKDATTLAITFHESDHVGRTLDDPLFASIVRLDTGDGDEDALTGFKDQSLKDGYYALSITLEDFRTFLYLVEIYAVAEPTEPADFNPVLPALIGEPVYYAEFTPPAQDIIDPFSHAIEHYKNYFHLLGKKGTVDLTGLVPDGLA